jgi:hypothetical protein
VKSGCCHFPWISDGVPITSYSSSDQNGYRIASIIELHDGVCVINNNSNCNAFPASRLGSQESTQRRICGVDGLFIGQQCDFMPINAKSCCTLSFMFLGGW